MATLRSVKEDMEEVIWLWWKLGWKKGAIMVKEVTRNEFGGDVQKHRRSGARR